MSRVNISSISNLIVTLIALILFIYLGLLYVTTHAIEMIYQSDIISLPYLYQDLFYHGGNLSHWQFPPSFRLFPDVMVYFTLAFIVKNLKLAMLLFAAFQFLLYYGLIVGIGKKIVKSPSSIYIFSISAFLTFFLYAAGTLQQNIFYAPALSGHFGTALMFLAELILILNTFSSKNYLNYIFLSLICLLTVFSDLLFLTQFVVTALVSLVMIALLSDRQKLKAFRINMAVIAISSAIGYILFHSSKFFFNLHIVHSHPLIKRFHPSDLITATKSIYHSLFLFYENNALIILLLFVFFIVSFVFLTRLWIQRIKGKCVLDTEQPFVFTIIMLFMSILIGYFSLIFLDNDVLVDPSLRHFQPFVLFPVFLGIPLYIANYSNLGEIILRHYKSLVLVMLACALLFAPSGSLLRFFTYYPPKVACVDYYADSYHLKNGVGQYWDAKVNSFLSKKGITIAAIYPYKQEIVPSLWYTTVNDFLNKTFNFVMVDNTPTSSLTPQIVIKAYGPPLKILQCPNPTQDPVTLYLYKEGTINASWTRKSLHV